MCATEPTAVGWPTPRGVDSAVELARTVSPAVDKASITKFLARQSVYDLGLNMLVTSLSPWLF